MIYYNSDKQENAILQVQRSLRDIERFENDISGIRLNGVYDQETRNAVLRLQEKYGLPVTGVVDRDTWLVIMAVDKAVKEATELARAVYILPKTAEYTIYPDLEDNVVYVIQHMINVISQEYDEIAPVPFTGVYDIQTQNAIKEFQRKNLLDADGIISPMVFNALSREYERINNYNE